MVRIVDEPARGCRAERAAVTEEMTLTVNGMTCGGCENAVKRVVATVPGVSDVTASHRDNRVTVAYDPGKADRAAIAAAIEKAGYRVQ
jgi:copper chaperone